MRLSRLLAITILLINRRRVTASELSERFGISVRTVYRDIEALREAEIPVTGCQGNNGGFAIMDNYRLSRQMLTFNDIVAICTTLKGINQSLKNSDIDTIIEKIGCMIPEEREEEFISRSEHFVFDISPWVFGNQQHYLDILYAAITKQYIISFIYTDYNGSPTSRSVEPMSLVFKSNTWYLFAYCRKRNDYRIFKLSRMKNITDSNELFTRREKKYHDILPQQVRPKNPIELSLRFVPNILPRIESFYTSDQLTTLDDGSILATAIIDYDEWIYSWILGFGDQVEVIAPECIKKNLLERIAAMQKKY